MSDITQSTKGFNLIFIHSSLDDAGLTAVQFRIFAHLSRRASSGQAFPSADSIAETCRVNRNTVWPALKELERRKMILKTSRKGLTNLWRIALPDQWDMNPPQTDTRLSDTSTPRTHPIATHPDASDSHEGNPSEGNPLKDLPTPLACRREGEDPFNPEPMAEPIPAPVKQVKQPRPRDLILDTLATLDGSLLAEVTEAAWGAARAAKKQIMAVYPQLTPEEINRRAANYRREWPNATIGAMAMAKHWAKFADTFKLPPELAAPKFTPAEAWDHSDDLIGRQMAQQRAGR